MKKSRLQQLKKARRSHRTRFRISGTTERPRLSVHRTLKHISAQLIDDTTGQTLAHVFDLTYTGTKTEKAAAVGEALAKAAEKKNITEVVFDRGAFRYHGRVKALADSARSAGLKF